MEMMTDAEAAAQEREWDQAEAQALVDWLATYEAFRAEYLPVWRAVRDYGGIRADCDYDRHDIPAGLYRVKGHAADLVAAEACIDSGFNAPWGDDGDSEAMMQWLRKTSAAWKRHLDAGPSRQDVYNAKAAMRRLCAA